MSANKASFVFSDAVIIGASSLKHLEENLKSTKRDPLHEGEFDIVFNQSP